MLSVVNRLQVGAMNSALEYSNKNPPLGGFLVDKCLSAFATLWRDGRIIIFVIARECNDRGNPDLF